VLSPLPLLPLALTSISCASPPKSSGNPCKERQQHILPIIIILLDYCETPPARDSCRRRQVHRFCYRVGRSVSLNRPKNTRYACDAHLSSLRNEIDGQPARLGAVVIGPPRCSLHAYAQSFVRSILLLYMCFLIQNMCLLLGALHLATPAYFEKIYRLSRIDEEGLESRRRLCRTNLDCTDSDRARIDRCCCIRSVCKQKKKKSTSEMNNTVYDAMNIEMDQAATAHVFGGRAVDLW
jgi:hypothetical protein